MLDFWGKIVYKSNRRLQKRQNSHVGKALISGSSRENNASGVDEGSLMLCPTEV
ncbi:MAG: hypothetical protein IKS41_03565 [Alphaproteobacteria bacterium]|nr:hypothetical protein [Alphaproteobacteria bacterium]